VEVLKKMVSLLSVFIISKDKTYLNIKVPGFSRDREIVANFLFKSFVNITRRPLSLKTSGKMRGIALVGSEK
jgi:hypothetical protein